MANKYLDNAGLDHMWDKIKTYLTNNYAAKSHMHTIAQITNLQTTLNGKANSSHTHTTSQITDLQTELDKIPTITRSSATANMLNSTYTLPSLKVGEIRFHILTANQLHNTRPIKAPSGGTYGMIYELPSQSAYTNNSLRIEVFTGGSDVAAGQGDAKNYVLSFFYIRIS